MNKLIILLSCCLLSQLTALGQARENKLQMSLGVQNGISITIPDADEKLIDKVWKNYTKEYGKLNRNRKADEDFINNATIKSIHGENSFDLYVITEDNSLTAFFDLKNGFLNSTDYPKEFAGAKEFIQEFSFEVQREKTRSELEDEQDKLKKLNKKMANLLQDNKNYHDDIENAKAKIKKAEANIITNDKDQDITKSEISNQTKMVESVQNKLNKIGKSN
ncbi:MAG: hypothetical protein WAR77_14235 [Saprospiraceae bacterium]|nr:hypothetical protein [Saprospiraceae bacterium]MBK8485287.1 hypothetical protein [Saprospiraceae bacterium]MBK9222505.1 hypothetical protein [Saprospiraceae bacterium]MBK9727433.1 hypothetical protein [Saprospiraceae bacterium]